MPKFKSHDSTAMAGLVETNKIDAREWCLWLFAILVTLCLTFGICSFAFGAFNSSDGGPNVREWLRALVSLVLLFDLYTLYQHLQLFRTRRLLYQRNQMFQLITENAADMIALVDREGRSLYTSSAYEEVLGYSAEALQNTPAIDRIHPDDRPLVLEVLAKTWQTGRGQRLEYRVRHKDGSWRYLESTGSAVLDSWGDVDKLVIVNRDITDRKRAEQTLAHRKLHDALTDLPNRELFLDRLQRVLAFSSRHPDFCFAVLLVDIDGFKVVNGSLGHSAGDELMIQISQRLTRCIRRTDTTSLPSKEPSEAVIVEGIARIASDEFTVLAEEIRDANDSIGIAKRIQQVLAAPFLVGSHEIVVSASVGIALSSELHSTPSDMLRDAEIAMHRAKRRGRGACEVFENSMHTNAVRRLEIEGKLRRAVAGSELFVNYQPIVSLADNTIIGFEALSRWSTREGMISPLEFMPIADETGLILPINRALLEEASQQMLRWQQQYPREQPLYLSINISPRQFSHPQLAAEISLTLQNAGLAPRSVRLEILETVAVQDLEMASRVITELKELGLRLSIDDFGTGYSSLSRLNCLPIDAIKIDSSLIWNMEKDEKSREIVKTIIMLAHTMKLDVVAEGIETPTHLELVREFGSDAAQGYLFSKPVSAEQVDLLLNSLRPVIDDASGVLTYA